MFYQTQLCILVLGFSFISSCQCYRPVICISHFLDYQPLLKKVCAEIAKAHPGTNVNYIRPLGMFGDFLPLEIQEKLYSREIMPIFEKNPGGVNVVAVSLGNFIIRSIIQKNSKHTVHTYIHVSGHINGHATLPYLGELGKLRILLRIWYNPIFRKISSVFQTYHDAVDEKLYREKNKFLPKLNNIIDHSKKTEYKKNFLRMKKLVLITGTKDEVVTPWQSNIGGFYGKSLNTIIDMKDYVLYTNDTFGLRTMDERKALTVIKAEGLRHLDFVSCKKNMYKYIIPYLS